MESIAYFCQKPQYFFHLFQIFQTITASFRKLSMKIPQNSVIPKTKISPNIKSTSIEATQKGKPSFQPKDAFPFLSRISCLYFLPYKDIYPHYDRLVLSSKFSAATAKGVPAALKRRRTSAKRRRILVLRKGRTNGMGRNKSIPVDIQPHPIFF